MTKSLTPAEARRAALDMENVCRSRAGRMVSAFASDPLIATLRAYADLIEAVREMLPHYEGMETGDGKPCPQMARLRSLMEKNHD